MDQDNTESNVAPFAMTRDIVTDMFPVDREPRIPTMDRPLIIESACPGFQVGGARYPAIPVTLDDQIKAQVDSLKAGAVIAHVHPDRKLAKRKWTTDCLPGSGRYLRGCRRFRCLYPFLVSRCGRRGGLHHRHSGAARTGRGNKYVQGTPRADRLHSQRADLARDRKRRSRESNG
jgi:hypothetical protein